MSCSIVGRGADAAAIRLHALDVVEESWRGVHDARAMDPDELRWDNYVTRCASTRSATISATASSSPSRVTLLNLLTCSLAGYSFAKFHYPGRNLLFGMVLATMMIPLASMIIPLFIVVRDLGWVDSYWGLIIPAGTSAFGIFLMRQHMLTIPDDLLDAARLDGSSEPRIFFGIVVPMSKTALSSLAIFIFMWNWDSFFWPLLVATDDQYRTLPLGIALFESSYGTNYPQLMAVAFMAMLPVLDRLPGAPAQFHRGADDVRASRGRRGSADADRRTAHWQRARPAAGRAGRFVPGAGGQSAPRSALHGGDGQRRGARRSGGDSRRRRGGHHGDPAMRSGRMCRSWASSRSSSRMARSSSRRAPKRARAVIAAGARLVALDGTTRPRPGGEQLARRGVGDSRRGRRGAGRRRNDRGCALCRSTCGVDAVGTTLSGYTPDSPKSERTRFSAPRAAGPRLPRTGLCRGENLDAGGGAAGDRARRGVRRRRNGDHESDRDHGAVCCGIAG